MAPLSPITSAPIPPPVTVSHSLPPNAPVTGSNLTPPISSGAFVLSSLLNLGINAGIRYVAPDLSPRWQPVITLGTSTATFYALHRMGVVRNFSPLMGLRAMPVIAGLSIGSSFLLDSTLGYLPYVGQTFQSSGWVNQLTSSFISFGAPLLAPSLVYSPWTTLTRLAITGGLGTKILVGGAILAIEAGVFALVNQGFGLIDSSIDYVKSIEVDSNTWSIHRSDQKIIAAKMEEYVWEAELKEVAYSKFPRPLASFASNHLGFFVKGGSKFVESISSTSHQNREARRARMRALVINDFSEITRANIAQAIVDSLPEDETDQAPQINWEAAESKIKESYRSNPNTKLFYQYDYPKDLIDRRYFTEGENPIEKIQALKSLVYENGVFAHHAADSKIKKQKQLELINLTLSVLEIKRKEYAEKYPNNEPTDKAAHPNFVVALGPLNEDEQLNHPLRREFAQYANVKFQIKQLKKIKHTLEKE